MGVDNLLGDVGQPGAGRVRGVAWEVAASSLQGFLHISLTVEVNLHIGIDNQECVRQHTRMRESFTNKYKHCKRKSGTFPNSETPMKVGRSLLICPAGALSS